MTLAHVLERKRVCICAGSGGVGKTTTAAAVAVGLAASGRRVAVVTIDPARRLADSLGLAHLTNDPQPVRGVAGDLWALTLDAKLTFDELVERLAADASTREAILANPIYQALSGAVAGSQEFSAIAKLYDLQRCGRFDVIVLDTPPSRHALDFLDAPERIIPFVERRAARAVLAPGGAVATMAARGTGLVLSTLRRITGADLLEDLDEFLRAFSGVAEGLAERAHAVSRLLADPATTFLVISSPERIAVEEAVYFRRRLASEGLHHGAVIVNRVHPLAREAPAGDPAGLAEGLGGDRSLAGRAAQALHDLRQLAERDAAAVERLAREVGADPILVPELATEVHDLEALAAVRGFLFATPRRRAALLAEVAF